MGSTLSLPAAAAILGASATAAIILVDLDWRYRTSAAGALCWMTAAAAHDQTKGRPR